MSGGGEPCQDSMGGAGCGAAVHHYRQCGLGGTACKRIIAYCDAHGGDARSAQEMRLHHIHQHHMAPTQES